MHDNDHGIGRRPVLKTAGMTLAGLGGLASPVAADHAGGKGKGGHLADTTADFAIFWSNVDDTGSDPDHPDDFGFPDGSYTLTGGPFIGGTDPGSGAGLFDGRDIEISPNHQTLHHSLRFFAGILMKGKAKPYTLVNLGDGVFESRGQTTNFEARSAEAIKAILQQLNLPTSLVDVPPISILAGEKWRAVASEQLKVDLSGDAPFDSDWAATRVDFYSRGGGRSEYTFSLLYSIWRHSDQSTSTGAFGHAGTLISEGRLNPGGQ